MKNTKTTIRELSARYRDVLKKCFFLNAMALGLFVSTSANAADSSVVTEVSGTGVVVDTGSLNLMMTGVLIDEELSSNGIVKNIASDAASNAVNALDVTKSQAAGADGLALSIEQENGVIKSISGSIAANTYDAYGAAATAEGNAKTYTDNKVAGLDASASQTAGTDGLALSITEVDGKITAITGSIAANTYDAYGAASTAEGNAKNYTDGLLGDDFSTTNTVSDALNQEATTRGEMDTLLSGAIITEAETREAQIGNIASVAGSSSYLAPANDASPGSTDPVVQPSVAEHLITLGSTLEGVLGTVGDLQTVFENSGEATNLATYLTSQAEKAAETQERNEAQFSKLSSKINKLETKMEKGLAANNALTGLVPLDHVHKTQISAALGGYKDNQALAVGAFHYLNNRTLLNAGAAYGGNDSLSYKVGVTFGF